MRTEVILPSSISKNRIFIPYLNKIKRVFNFCGFSYRSNKWYIDKINNIFVFISLKSIFFFILLLLSLTVYLKFFFNEYSFSFFVVWKSIEILEDFCTSILIYIYCFLMSLKIHTWRFLFKKDIVSIKANFDDSYRIRGYSDNELSNCFKMKLNSDKLILFKYLYKSGSFSLDTGYLNKPKTIDDFLINNFTFNKPNSLFTYTNSFININSLYFNKKRNNSMYLNTKNIFSFYYLNNNFQNFKNLKLNQWFSKYSGLNSTNYNYFYGINTKFNSIGNNFKLFNSNFLETGFNLNNNDGLKLFFKNNENSFFRFYLNYNNFLGSSNSWLFNKINLYQLMLNNNNQKTLFKNNDTFSGLNINLLRNTNNFLLNSFNSDNFFYFNNFNFYNIGLKSGSNKKYNKPNSDMSYIKKIFFFKI